MKILHIPTANYCILAPISKKHDILYILDARKHNKEYWCGVIDNITLEEWNNLWESNRIPDIYVEDRYYSDASEYRTNNMTDINKNEFELVE